MDELKLSGQASEKVPSLTELRSGRNVRPIPVDGMAALVDADRCGRDR